MSEAEFKALAEKKRAELEGALDRGEVHDPFSSAIITSLIISAALAGAQYVVGRAFAPKPPKQTQGKLTGSLQLQNSEQGLMIPEIYGAGPAASIAAGANPTYQNLTNVTGGANGSITKTSGADQAYNAGASHNVSVIAGDDAFLRIVTGNFIASAGFFNTASPTGSGSTPTGLVFGIQWSINNELRIEINAVGTVIGTYQVGDTFTIELRSGRFRLYKGSSEIFSTVAPPTPSYPLYMGVIMFTSGAGVSNAKVKINDIGDPANFARGGIRVPAIIDWSSGIRKNVTTTQQPVGGKGFGGRTQTTENITYDIDLGLSFAIQGPYDFLRLYANADVLLDQMETSGLVTGVYDPGVGPDADYDPELPPDPNPNYLLPRERVNAEVTFDGDGVGTGSIVGGAVQFALYSGTQTQEPDPTEEADIDAKYGTGSTPAHRGKARAVLTNFDLSRWGGIVPNMTAALQHQELITLDDIYASFCERVNVQAANDDYDWSGLSTIQPRGMLVAGRLFSPAEIIGSPDIQTVYNYQATEAEGQLIGWLEGDEPEVTIPDTEVGWLDSDADMPDVLPEVDTLMASEISLSRQVDVKYIDLDREWEPNTQSDNRQVTEGVTTEIVEVQLALLSEEARTAAQRKLYRDYVAGSVHKFTLPWTYIYLYPGYKITITRLEGFSHVLRLRSITGGIGWLECEGEALEPATFTQPATGSISPGFPPPQPVPAMIVMSMLDIPLFRDGDAGKLGYYAGGTPRTGANQTFNGWVLNSQRNSVWSVRGSSTLPATIGSIVSATSLSDDPETFDNVGVITVDLYGTTASLSSVTEADVLAGLNLAVARNFIFGFTTATQVAGFPNRWELEGLLNGLHGTAHLVPGDLTGTRFVLLDQAVTFIPTTADELNLLLTYRGVAIGQSLGDAASFDFAWEGKSITPPKRNGVVVYRDTESGGTANQIQFVIPTDGLVGELKKYWVDVYSATAGPTFTVDASTNVFTSTSHGLVAGDIIALSTSGELPYPLQKNKHYYLISITTHTFKLSTSVDGPEVDLKDTGTGTHKFTLRVRHMPCVNYGTFNPAVITIYTPDDTPPPDGEWQHATTAGSGGWDSTITTEWTESNDVVGDGPGAAGGGISAAALALAEEAGFEMEFTLGTVDYAPGIATDVMLSEPEFLEDDAVVVYRNLRFTQIVEVDLPPAKAGSRRWKLTIHERATAGDTLDLVYTDPDVEIPGMKYRMQYSGTELRYYRDYGGPNSKLLYRSTLPLILPLRPRFSVATEHRIDGVKIGGLPDCVTTYPESEQTADFSTQPATFRFRVYEERTTSGITFFGDATDFVT